jgi:alkanesulfonate monooxygenase SsuD/methylene tetrahydromethanopterin reductase-like flavin-dependent oxidoreductase (luciferase family)
MAATVDVISGGRLDFGVGAGWNEYEHESMGIPLYAPGERIRRLGEACEIIKRLFTQHLTDFDGRYYQLKEARCEPKPVQKPYPPFVIGGGGEQLTLRVVARYADIWNFGGGAVEEFRRKIAILHTHCAEVGRDPATIELSVQMPVHYDDLEETVQTVQRYVDAGATHLILNLRYPYPEGIVTRLAEEVVPRVRGAYKRPAFRGRLRRYAASHRPPTADRRPGRRAAVRPSSFVLRPAGLAFQTVSQRASQKEQAWNFAMSCAGGGWSATSPTIRSTRRPWTASWISRATRPARASPRGSRSSW